jgi:hypothetical protein
LARPILHTSNTLRLKVTPHFPMTVVKTCRHSFTLFANTPGDLSIPL